ncbi:MAG: tyrosine--tRNA ligase [Actinobacteria bacterium]|nr:tyrosine--tRNA ligase [Actinomycetota bacterium]
MTDRNSVDGQMEVITSGVVEVIPLDEMRKKIARSIDTGKPLTVKLGVDPTRPDLHIGHAVPLNKLRHFQELGHEIVLIIGDFTALIGDPSMQDVTRPVLTTGQVEENARTYIEQAGKIIDTEKARLVHNSEWLAPLDFRGVLELTSKFTVARILERDDFQRRYREEKPLGLHEFLYPVMQAYDSVQLQSDVEIGGTDQKFNLLAGRNLQRSTGQEPQCVLTLPLLEGTDGLKKMSKSLENDVGLTDPPGEMFGKVMSIPDEIMWKYFELATKVDPAEAARLKAQVESGNLNPRDAKERLASEIVTIYYSKEKAEEASSGFRRVFSDGETPENMEVVAVPESLFNEGRIWVVDLIVELGLAPSKGEARRLIEGGGIYIGGNRITDKDLELAVSDLSGKVLRKGRKTFLRLKINT